MKYKKYIFPAAILALLYFIFEYFVNNNKHVINHVTSTDAGIGPPLLSLMNPPIPGLNSSTASPGSTSSNNSVNLFTTDSYGNTVGSPNADALAQIGVVPFMGI